MKSKTIFLIGLLSISGWLTYTACDQPSATASTHHSREFLADPDWNINPNNPNNQLALVDSLNAIKDSNQVEEEVVKDTIETIKKNKIEMPTLEITKEYLMGQFDPSSHKDFTRIPTKYASSGEMLMRKDALADFKKMYEAARKDGVYLKIRSATRPFKHQKRIWNGKWTGQRLVEGQNISKTIPKPLPRALKILRFSSMPGTSRHHWGTDIDLNNFENSYFEKGTGLKIYTWLVEHAATYGFCQTYTAKGAERPDGYEEEKWHWSYMPISKQLTTAYAEMIQNDHIAKQDFKGATTATEIGIVEKYVLGINQMCK